MGHEEGLVPTCQMVLKSTVLKSTKKFTYMFSHDPEFFQAYRIL